MKKSKITILALVVLTITIFSQSVKAAEPSLYVLPTKAKKKVGSVFDIAVKVDPARKKEIMKLQCPQHHLNPLTPLLKRKSLVAVVSGVLGKIKGVAKENVLKPKD